MIELLTFILITVGMTNIATTSWLFRPIRVLLNKHIKSIGEMVTCSMCFGFWAGVVVAYAGYPAVQAYNQLLEVIFSGCVSSYVCWVLLGETGKYTFE